MYHAHILLQTRLWVNLCHSIISLLVIRDAPLELACAHVRTHPSLPPLFSHISWPTSALVSAASACALNILLLSISMINKCRPQHYWHLNHNNSASFGQNMLRLYKPHSLPFLPHLPTHTLAKCTLHDTNVRSSFVTNRWQQVHVDTTCNNWQGICNHDEHRSRAGGRGAATIEVKF